MADTTRTQMATLRQLTKIINDSLDTIEATYTTAGVHLPTLNTPSFSPTDPSEALRADPAVAKATLDVMAAAAQLSAEVCSPLTMMLNASQSFYIASCLNVASELNVVEILKEYGTKGLHVNEIAARCKAEPGLLSRILRLLATHHVFREVTPDVFANNRISAVLDKGQSAADLFAKPEDRFNKATGVIALAEFFSNDILRCSAELTATILDPKPNVYPYNRAFNTDLPMYYFLQRPENAYRLKRFALGMQGTETTGSLSEGVLGGFDWDSLPTGGVVVDVGCGNGHVSLSVAQKHPKLKIINQDLEMQVAQAKQHWQTELPSHVENQLVEFQEHDFFKPQPVKNADVFMMRFIAHNWDDAKLAHILQNLRDAAKPTTKLVILDKIQLFAARAPAGGDATLVLDAGAPQAQEPLLPNWGIGNTEYYFFDIGVHIMLGGGERTLPAFVAVLEKAHWRLEKVYRPKGSHQPHLVAVPI
ncbi:hypothetical protein MIND_00641100 [Mycena indigotica]|uniref:S-adenosyl-L-methionine-dependent methyltransferase n=1 Tax=Mycena indigotica TaxID=2126181 RepID=A0A8H6W603_9AGAR|nr:uncharacterized protein MIND_00641100 [Mycena indigotica]KAF7304096.1 hypothetical protein MIND_00641100 [Mycena indigotica]